MPSVDLENLQEWTKLNELSKILTSANKEITDEGKAQYQGYLQKIKDDSGLSLLGRNDLITKYSNSMIGNGTDSKTNKDSIESFFYF